MVLVGLGCGWVALGRSRGRGCRLLDDLLGNALVEKGDILVVEDFDDVAKSVEEDQRQFWVLLNCLDGHKFDEDVEAGVEVVLVVKDFVPTGPRSPTLSAVESQVLVTGELGVAVLVNDGGGPLALLCLLLV